MQKNMHHCHLVHQKFHTHTQGMNPRLHGEKPASLRLRHFALNYLGTELHNELYYLKT